MKTAPRSDLPPLVSIVIPVFNKCDLTVNCLKALSTVTKRIAFEVIVVDNASSDATPQHMLGQAGHVRYIRNEVNRNFAGACNQGAAVATGKYLLFLNNDTIPHPGWLEALVDELRTHPEVVMAGSKLLYRSGQVQHAGVVFARETRSPFHPYRLLRADDPRVNHRRELQAVTAACMLIRPQWFSDCGGFCEEFRNGYEDLDLCLKIRMRGGVIVYQPNSVVTHLESQSPGRMKYDNENRALFFRRWRNAVLSDEDAFYFADGFRLGKYSDRRPEMPRLIRFAGSAERDQWSALARCQKFAAEWRKDELVRELSETAAWPEDAAVRRWAGSLCQRLNLFGPAREHFKVSLKLEHSIGVQLLLATSARAKAETPMQTSPGDEYLEVGFDALRDGDYAQAQAAFETALLKGAPPGLALGGFWRAAGSCGSSAEQALARHALLALPRTDPHTTRLLHREHDPAVVSTLKNSGAPHAGRCDMERGLSGTANPHVSIIVLALDQLEHTRRCLDSLAARTPQPHELIVVDNGSTDGTPGFLKQWQAAHSNCTVIRNEANRGFAAGNNQGISIARGDHIVLLNNDTVVTEGWLENLLNVLVTHPETGVVGPVSNNVSGPQSVPEAGYNDLDQLPAFAAKWSGQCRGHSIEVTRAVGFCLLARRAVVERIGGLDEQFGSGNFEDDDFCIRARLAGFRIRVAMDSFVHHTGSQTFKGAKIDFRKAMLRNWDLFRAKWQIGADVDPERGYPVPKSLPARVDLKACLPQLELSHKVISERLWAQSNTQPATPATQETPGVARIGNLDEVRASSGRREFANAGTAALAAIELRPFHPEAWLLLAGIARTAGDSAAAHQCAQRARDLAPNWKAPKQFLQKPIKGSARLDWGASPELISSPKSEVSKRLSVCVITRNEERFIGQCLGSVKAIAHQIVVIDTGSTDRTVEIAREYGAEIHSFEWCDDFSAARNVALEHARGDWVLMLDADEELPADQHTNLLKDLESRDAMAFRLPLVNHGSNEGRNYVPRLFRNAPGVFFRGRIHEQVFQSLLPMCKAWGLETRLGSAQLLHHGYTSELVRDRNKIERNLRLLRLAVQERPDDANLVMNLGLELVRSGELVEGLNHYRRAFRLLSSQPAREVVPELREVLLTQFSLHLYKARQYDEVLQVLNSPLAKNGGLTASLHFALGLAHHQLKQPREAAEQMRRCLVTRDKPVLSPINTDILGAAPGHCLALSLAQSGDAPGAEQAFQAALTARSHVEEVKLDYARFLAGQARAVDALHTLHEIVAQNVANADAWRLGGELALGSPEFLEFACDWTGEALRSLPEDSMILGQRAEALLLSQQTKEARPLWERVCNGARPPRALAAVILCTALESDDMPATRGAHEELAASRAFVEWYQRLISAGAEQLIVRLNSRIELLRQSLPTAARLLDSAMAEANVGAR